MTDAYRRTAPGESADRKRTAAASFHTDGLTVAPARGFPPAEFACRAARVQARMQAEDIDLLWLTTEADVRYLSGFHTPFWQSPTRPWHLLLPASGAPVAVIPGIGLVAMQRTWVQDVRTWSSPHPDDDGVSLLADTICELTGARARIGLPMGAESHLRFPLQDWERLRLALPNHRWVHDQDVLRQVRQIKSAAEVAKIRRICAIVSAAFADVPALVRPGMSEQAVFTAFRIACLQHGADEVNYLVGAAGPAGYQDIISPPSARRLDTGDVLILDTGCTFDGYFADFDRNFAIGRVDETTAAAHQRTWDATEAGLTEIARGQATCASVFRAMQSVLCPGCRTSASAADVGRLGHGLGSQLTETPSITAFDETPLLPGMVMTLEPGFSHAPGRMMVHEENLLVTDDGYELLSARAPRDIPIIHTEARPC